MFRAHVVNSSKHIVTHFVGREAEALFIAVEVNYKDPNAYRSDKMDRLHAKLVELAGTSPWNVGLPEQIASSLSPLADGYLFLGVVITNSILSVCHAGDLRLHVIVDSEIAHVTRVHNLIEDVPLGGDDGVESISSLLRMNVITRCLGQANSAPPEVVQWVVPSQAKVVVVSSLIHRYEPPGSYVFSLLHGDYSRLDRWEGLYAAISNAE